MFRIMRYLSKAEIGQMLIALVSIVGQIWLDLTLPDYMSDITTLVGTPGSEMHDIWIAGGKMLLISLGSAACAIIIGASFSQRLRSMEFRKVESFGPAEMSRFSTASLITRSTNDITQIQMFITMGLMMIVKSPIMAVWAVCKIAGDGLEWTLATGIAVVVLLVSITILMVLVMPKFKSMQRLTDNINLVARENLTGLRVVRAYNAEDYQEAKFTKANKELTDTQLFTNRAMAFMMPLMNTIMNGLMLAVYWIGAYLIDAADAADKLTTFSNMVVFSSYSVQVIMSFLLMSMVFVLWPRADVSAQRVLEVLDTEPLITDGTRSDAGEAGKQGEIEFRNVSFAYPDSRHAMLEGVNFKAKKGQTVAFIGSTGSGKSTILSLICRNYEFQKGQILIDGIDIRKIKISSLRRHFGQMLQDVFLFSGTIRSNIVLREENISDDEIMKVCRYVNADHFIDKLEHGLDEEVRERGNNFSAGQRQLLSFARTILHKPSVMILDEATANIDTETELLIQDSLEKMRSVGTMLIVAHRLSTIQHADNIIVLSHGKILEQGTHQQLLAAHGRYYQLYTLQYHKEQLKNE